MDSKKLYQTIVIDPPWKERGGGKIKRGADRHYPLLKTKDIPGVIYRSGVLNPAEQCHLYPWATNNFLPDALWVMECLGFDFKTIVTWAKKGDRRKFGLGQYFCGMTEHVLFGSRGKAMVPPTKDRGVTLIEAPRGEHSQKPSAMYDMIERVSPGPRLEIFAWKERPGWDVWGNEVIST